MDDPVGPPAEAMNPTYILLSMTVLYSLIFITGLIGNVSTCVVISRNRHMHTATNYYLFSLAVSDLLLLVLGLPQEMYILWAKTYVFGEYFCILTGIAAETCANATVLTITAFTVERYVAICHPFLSHTVSKLSRAIKYVIVIWIVALCLGIPQAIQFTVVKTPSRIGANGTVLEETSYCSLNKDRQWLHYSFQISTLVFFVAPMSLITALYLLIGVKLRRSRLIKRPNSEPLRAQKHVIRMLVAVVVGFFICWAPFHAQRLLAIYSSNQEPLLVTIYTALTHISGVLYYLSTTINPLLYNIMSRKFREAFKSTLAQQCGRRGKGLDNHGRTYSVLSRGNTQVMRAMDPRMLRQAAPAPATISNSSLQDAGVEYSGAELASYMGQLNNSR